PIAGTGAPEQNVGPEYNQRIQAYMMKALNEAKLNTSWIQPNEEWLAATRDFVAKVLDPTPKNKFLPAFLPIAEEIARLGAINSLAQTLVKLTSPGVPDIYQGNETWDFSLVDPDNRRPVDYKARAEMLSCLSSKSAEELLQDWPGGRVKMFLTQRALRFRSEHVDLFQRGNYLPLRASGAVAESCISFARQLDRDWVIVVVPRLSSRIGFPPIGERWKDTVIEVPENLLLERGREIFTGRELSIQNRQIRVAEALSGLPFTMVTNQ